MKNQNGKRPPQRLSTNGARKVKGKSVRTINHLLKFAKEKDNIRLVFDVTGSKPEVWTRLGFNKKLAVGDYLMPSAVGRVTNFNVHGKEMVRKDLPKRPKDVTFWGSWRDWHGYKHSGFKTRSFDKYPRERVPAPSKELYIIEIDSRTFIATDAIELSASNETRNVHLMNLMLECFGEFQVVDDDTGAMLGTKVRQLQWEVLPKGKYPWIKSKEIVKRYTDNLKSSAKMQVEARIKEISDHSPDFLATGNGGFSGYFVFGFKKKGVFVLESVHLDNATYVFGKDWETLSKLTKNEIINSPADFQRIIHNQGWVWDIRGLLR